MALSSLSESIAEPVGDAAPGAAEPFESMTALRGRHLELLKSSRLRPKENLGEVDDFLRRISATGKQLDVAADREAAQGILDYWTAAAHTPGGQIARASEPSFTRAAPPAAAPPPSLAEFDAAIIKTNAEAAERALAVLPDGATATADRVLLRMVEFALDGRGFATKSADAAALRALGDSAAVDRVVDALRRSGILRDAGDGRLELRHQASMRTWPRMQNILDRRRRFRDAVRYWEQHARSPAALVSGDLLDEALGYADLNDLEKEFLSASRSRERRHGQIAKSLAVLFGALAILAAFSSYRFNSANGELSETVVRLDAAKKSLEAANTKLSKTVSDLETANTRREKFVVNQERLTGVIGLTRVLAELGVANDEDSLRQAQIHWDSYRERAKNSPEFTSFLKEHDVDLDKIVDPKAAGAGNLKKYSIQALNLGRTIVSEMLRDDPETTQAVLKNLRSSAWAASKLCVDQIVTSFAEEPYANAEPLVMEFRILYWGEMIFVEGRKVETAMVRFGQQLDQIEKLMSERLMRDLETKKTLNAEELSWLAKTKQTYSNTRSILKKRNEPVVPAALDDVRRLKVPPAEVQTLRGRRQELFSAMDAESKGPVVPVPPN